MKNGCDATLVAVNGAEHADIFFAQDELWNMVAEFLRKHLSIEIKKKFLLIVDVIQCLEYSFTEQL